MEVGCQCNAPGAPGKESSVRAVQEFGLTAVHGQSRCYILGDYSSSKELRLGISNGFFLVGFLFLCCTWRRGQIQRSKCEFLSCGAGHCPKLPPDLSLYVELLHQDQWQILCCVWLEKHITQILSIYVCFVSALYKIILIISMTVKLCFVQNFCVYLYQQQELYCIWFFYSDKNACEIWNIIKNENMNLEDHRGLI